MGRDHVHRHVCARYLEYRALQWTQALTTQRLTVVGAMGRTTEVMSLEVTVMMLPLFLTFLGRDGVLLFSLSFFLDIVSFEVDLIFLVISTSISNGHYHR